MEKKQDKRHFVANVGMISMTQVPLNKHVVNSELKKMSDIFPEQKSTHYQPLIKDIGKSKTTRHKVNNKNKITYNAKNSD